MESSEGGGVPTGGCRSPSPPHLIRSSPSPPSTLCHRHAVQGSWPSGIPDIFL
ncbi:hypothetical protein BDV35DRAFT_365440 [Aspergillus flavus]|uniref:Uncharacterized protein n=1 Tax=Aspergillus flavus TaxID=5059 RepID=A0A5N6GNN1_ASPFL|nr:hypothetical protein BDV35DRAFT_365440 [Aspergillus flavus]